MQMNWPIPAETASTILRIVHYDTQYSATLRPLHLTVQVTCHPQSTRDTSTDSTASTDNLGAANSDVHDERAAGIDTSSDGNQVAASPDLSDTNQHSNDCSDVPSAKLKPVDQASTEGQDIPDTSPPGSFSQHVNTEARKGDIQQVLSRITLLESKPGENPGDQKPPARRRSQYPEGVKRGCSCNPGKQGQWHAKHTGCPCVQQISTSKWWDLWTHEDWQQGYTTTKTKPITQPKWRPIPPE